MEAIKETDLVMVAGPLKGRRFQATRAGVRLGRSSSCEISITDPALSRNHCLFEDRDGAIWVTDLASANGTTVNGEPLETRSRRLTKGDVVQAGDNILVMGEMRDECEFTTDDDIVQAEPIPGAEPMRRIGDENVDLGLGKKEAPVAKSGSPMRLILWLILVLVLGGSAVAILTIPREGASSGAAESIPLPPATLYSVHYEKVEASGKGICRYAIDIENGVMEATLDDVPDNDRHVKKSVELTDKGKEELNRIFSASELYRLEREYSGLARPNELTRYELRVARGTTVFSTTVENTQAPAALSGAMLQLEAFSQNELGIRAIQYSGEKLTEMSREAWQSADAKWEERDVNYGNLAAAIKLYDEAIADLETINPKPDDYKELLTKRDMAAKEMERKYNDQRFEVDRALNTGDMDRAKRELRVLLEMVPDKADERHKEAAAKLIDVENRK